MLKTVQITARAVSPNTVPFTGYIRVALHPNILDIDLDGEQKIFVADFINQKFPFRREGNTRFRLIPNSLLGEDTYYSIEIYKTEKVGVGSKDYLIHKSNVIVPDADCNLADLIITEPLVVEPIEASKLYAAEAKSAVASGKEVLRRAEEALDKSKSFFVWDMVKGADLQVYAAPQVNFEVFADMRPVETPPVSGEKSPSTPSTVFANRFLSISVGEVSGKKDTYTCPFNSPIWGGSLNLQAGTVDLKWDGYEFTGSEKFERVLIDGKYGFKIEFEAASITGGSDDVVVCSHFVSAPHGLGACYVSNGGHSFVMVPTDQTNVEIEDFQTWLQDQRDEGRPCTVVRKFNEPIGTVHFDSFDVPSLPQDDYFTPKLNIVTSNMPISLGYPVSPTYLYQKISVAVISLGGYV